MSKKKEDENWSKFLDFLDKDIEKYTEKTLPVLKELLHRADDLVSGVDPGDINERLPDDDE
jgi:hypothetical protein